MNIYSNSNLYNFIESTLLLLVLFNRPVVYSQV